MSTSAKKRLEPGEYASLVGRIRNAVQSSLPENATVLVVGKGDRELGKLGGRHVGHFPQNEAGHYAGYHPANDDDAIRHLESLRADGAEYLLLPRTAFWWLDHYRGLFEHLEQRGERVDLPTDDCRIWSLVKGSSSGPGAGSRQRPVPRVEHDEAGGHPSPRGSLDTRIDTRIDTLLDALFDSDTEVVHLRQGGEAPLRSDVCGLRSLRSPSPNDPDFADVLVALRSEGTDALLLSHRGHRDNAFEVDPRSTRSALERCLRRIAHREHLCSVYDLRGDERRPAPSQETAKNGQRNG